MVPEGRQFANTKADLRWHALQPQRVESRKGSAEVFCSGFEFCNCQPRKIGCATSQTKQSVRRIGRRPESAVPIDFDVGSATDVNLQLAAAGSVVDGAEAAGYAGERPATMEVDLYPGAALGSSVCLSSRQSHPSRW